MHRRAATLKGFSARPSAGLAADDMGQLRESPDEGNDESARKQLLTKERENDRLRAQIQTLQMQLSQRPSQEVVERMEKEYNALDMILTGTQKENEKCMHELENSRNRIKQLEKELENLAGENWRTNLDVGPANAFATRSAAIARDQAALASDGSTNLTVSSAPGNTADTAAQVEKVRLLILGMEQRLQLREDKLNKTVDRAENEGRKFQELRKDLHTLHAS